MKKGILPVLVLLILFLMFPGMTSAVTNLVKKNITVFTGVTVYLDKQQLDMRDANGKEVEAFIYNGTTYLPVRAVSKAIGKPITWDGKEGSLYIGENNSDEPLVYLNDLDYFNMQAKLKMSKSTVVKDNLGNSYNISMKAQQGNKTQWIEYIIDGQYSKFKGRLIVPYELRTTTYTGYIQVFGDDKLLYTSPTMTGGVEPVDFEVDITGVLKLKLEFNGASYFNIHGDIHEYMIVNPGLY